MDEVRYRVEHKKDDLMPFGSNGGYYLWLGDKCVHWFVHKEFADDLCDTLNQARQARTLKDDGK